MASKQLLRRIPLIAREGWSSVHGAGGAALPEAANDIVPLLTGTVDSPNGRANPPTHSLAPVAARGSSAAQRSLGPTLGQWTQRLSHLQSLQKPLSTLGVPAAAVSAHAEAGRPAVWPTLAANAAKQVQGTAPTAIAAATLPGAFGDILKSRRLAPAASAVDPAAASAEAVAADLREATEAVEADSAAAASAPSSAIAADAAVSGAPAHSDRLSLQQAGLSALPPPPPPPPLPHSVQLPQGLPPAAQHHQRRSSSGTRGASAASSSIQLNKNIMACRNTEELLSLVQHRGAHFDYFNISTALARVPKLVAGNGPSSGYMGAAAYAGMPPPPPPGPHSGGSGSGASSGGAGMMAVGVPGAPPLPGDLHVDAAGRALLDLLAQLMVGRIDSFDARGLANSAWAFGKVKYVPAGGLPSVIAQAALRRMHELSPQNLSNLVWAFVYMHHADEQLLAAAARYVCARVHEFKPQELANIVWAFASLGHRDDQMLHIVAEQAQRIAPLFKEQELSNVLWALGKMGLRDRPDVLESLMAETRCKLPAFLPQGISNVAWALAAVGHADMLFLDRVVAQCGSQLGGFDVQALANLVWAMASLGYHQPHFLAAVVNECLGRGLDRLSPQNLSNILWGCATLNHRDPRMLTAWAAQTLEKLASFEPQGLSNTAWAFARLGYNSPQLFQALGAAALHKLDGFTAQGLSNLAWAMATAGHTQPRLFEAISRHAVSLAPAFNAQNCSVLLWAAASTRHYDERLFEALLGRLVALVEAGPASPGHAQDPEAACEPQNVANALWAVARVGHPLSTEAAGPLLRHAVRLLPRMSQQELCNTMWAVACLDLMDEHLFAAFCDCVTRLPDISQEGMHQIYHAQLLFHSRLARAAGVSLTQLQQLASSNPPSSLALLPRLPEPLHSLAASMWAASARDVHVSRFHQEVSGALATAGIPHAVEWLTDDQHFSVDIGLQVNSQPCAVEVNGAHHFTSNAPHRPLGDMGVRRRLLNDRGWAVVDVGFADWESMGRTLAERGSSLVGRIAATLDTFDWQYAGLPQRSPGAASVPPPAAVVPAAPAPAPLPAPAALPTPQAQAQAQAQALQSALAAAMGLGSLYPATASATTSTDAASLAAAGGWGAWASLAQLAAAGAGSGSGMDLDRMDRAGSTGSALDESTVQAAVEAAEALGALPGGNLLLAQQAYGVLGLGVTAAQLEAAQRSQTLAALEALAASQLCGPGSLHGHHHALDAPGDEHVVSDDDLERVVQFALA
ncbi:hypothetical protein HYH03_013048 [Edaphochlamys debaryana]|uniref:RAP domain-containing protein n=1 Tax=Edaphochlamys debaryana TaxID=47281 RepID=A0A835XQF4_9CHLO|nr:hypothetical protein HYH03_013048 [Edaphochlamys debaryana]|eukprot:KAG2488358.1 hypothetical protein HYH03_013048 [Edaphochlamys debaryana]